MRVADISSILRPPGTINHKSAPVPVLCGPIMGPYGVEEFDGLRNHTGRSVPTVDKSRNSRHVLGALPIWLRELPAFHYNFTLNKAIANVFTTEPVNIELLVRNCGQLKHFEEARGVIPEPIWYAGIGLLAWVDGGEALAHRWSMGDPRYTHEETARRIERTRELDGPTTRAKYESLNPKICAACLFQCKHGPIEAGRAKISEKPVIPIGFSDRNGGISYVADDTDGKPANVKVTSFPVYVHSVHTGELNNDKHYYLLHHHKPHAGWKDVTLHASDLYSDSVAQKMADIGVIIHHKSLYIRYIRESVELLEKKMRAAVSYDQFGWKDGNSAFLYGDRLYVGSSDPASAVCGVDRTSIGAELAYRAPWLQPVPGGSLSAWKQAIDQLMGKGSEGMSFTVLAAFAAPLMRFLEVNEGGAVISLVTRQSGAGKSTTLAGARSVWASDKRALDLVDIDTRVSKSVVLGALCNLPVTFDEFQNRDPAIVAQFLITFTNGRDKNRARSDGTLIHSAASWQTLLITAGNQSLQDTVKAGGGTEAPAMRILEMPINSTPVDAGILKQSELMALAETLSANAGHAGDAYLRYLVQPGTLAWVRSYLPECVDEIMVKCNFGKEHRFWARTLAAVTCASTIVNKLGLVSFSPDRIMGWALDHFGQQRAAVSAEHDKSSMLGHLAAFLDEKIDEILHMPSAARGKTQIPPLGELPRRKIIARIDHDTMTCYVAEMDLRKWLERNSGGGYSTLLNELKAANLLIVSRRSMTLGAGTRVSGGQVPVMGFDMASPAFSGIVREAQEIGRTEKVLRKLGVRS